MKSAQEEVVKTTMEEPANSELDPRNAARYFFEIGHLKDVPRTGWTQIGIHTPESVAQHSYRAAIIGYVLASMAGADPQKVATLCLFHDTPETRVMDLHWTAKRYIGNVKEAEHTALEEQLSRLPLTIATSIIALFEEYDERSTLEGLLAREADLLECIFQAREYMVRGYVEAEDWIAGCLDALKTETAKSMAHSCVEMMPSEWFVGLKQKPNS
jgi:putative hydrolases of HD superfamily